jgi:predicted nucleic acid-binding protein
VVVVDASALAALAFGEPEAAGVTARIEFEPIHAPALLDLEMANATLSRCRRHAAQKDRLLEGLVRVLAIPIERHAVDTFAVLALALETGLTAYDAAYLWLARELDASLVTLDKDLAAAARWR